MKYLLDTHLLLWITSSSDRLPKKARELFEESEAELFYSAASIWEISIKFSTKCSDFDVDPRVLRRGLDQHGYIELAITGEHAAMVCSLPSLHKDPFDRVLVAQAIVEGIKLVTVDAVIASYPCPVIKL